MKGYPYAERRINWHQNDMVKVHNIYLFIRKLEVIMAEFSKMIKLGFSFVVFGSAGIAIRNQTGILSDTVYNSIFIVLLGLGSILFIVGCCKGDTA